MKIKLTITTAFFFLSIIINTISHFSYKASNSPLSEGCPQDGVFAQNIGMNGTGANAHPSALVDIDASPGNNTGFLMPRIPLQGINLAAPVTSPATSLLVYNTATASTGTNAVSPGYYYWDGLKWVRFSYSASGSSANDWNVLGNAGTVAGTNFLGTTDNQDLVFKRNNTQAGLLNVSNGATSFGVGALNILNTGASNSAFGNGALGNNTTGYFNTAIGTSALSINNTGFFNTGVGDNAMAYNTTGSNNAALGANASLNNTTGSLNVSFGAYASYSNTTGSDNTSVGYSSLYSNTTGSLNVAVGSQAGFSNTIGERNTFIGTQAGYGTTTSGGNTAVGYLSLNGTNNGSLNSALGFRSLQNNTMGTENLATGYAALFQNTTGLNNTATGAGTMRDNTTGNNNTAVGRAALSLNLTGSNNTVIGQRAGATNSIVTTHNNNTFIGAETDATVNNLTNATAIGYNAKVGQSNALILGGTGTDAVNVGIGTTTPNYQLDVHGTGQAMMHIQSSTTGLAYLDVRNTSTGTTNNGAIMRLITENALGTGVTTADVGKYANGTLFFNNWDNSPSVNTIFCIGSNTMTANAIERMRITSAGNVGINTTTPSEKLEVQGSVKIVDGTQGTGKVLTSDATGKSSWILPGATGYTGTNISFNTVNFTTTDTYAQAFINIPVAGQYVLLINGSLNATTGTFVNGLWALSTSNITNNQVFGSTVFTTPATPNGFFMPMTSSVIINVTTPNTFYLWGRTNVGSLNNGLDFSITAVKIN